MASVPQKWCNIKFTYWLSKCSRRLLPAPRQCRIFSRVVQYVWQIYSNDLCVMKANLPWKEHLTSAKVPNTFLTSKAPLTEQGHSEYITCNLRNCLLSTSRNKEFLPGSVKLYVELHYLFGDIFTTSCNLGFRVFSLGLREVAEFRDY